MSKTFISKNISKHVLMAGNYYKHHHPGGISAVVQYWSDYIENLQYYPTYKLSNIFIRTWWFCSSLVRLTARMLFDKNIKILHLHTAADGSFWRKAQLVKLGHALHKKVILHVHASRFKDFYNESSTKKREWIKDVLDKVDVLIVLSESWKKWFTEIGINGDKIIILHNITPYPTIIQEAKVQDGKIHFLFLGEIGKRKGVFDILNAISKNRSFFEKKLQLRIGGNRNEKKLLETIKKYKLENIVFFEGWVGGEKKIELLNWADLYILPSFNEGLPISILEAMSYGLPIISTPVGGIPEVVKGNGVLVTPGNIKEIHDAIKKYIDNPLLIEKERNISLKMVETYLPDFVMNQLKNIYEKLLVE